MIIFAHSNREQIEDYRITSFSALAGGGRREQCRIVERQELHDWGRARSYWDRAAASLDLARNSNSPDVRNRYVTIVQHYRMLAKAEERNADQKGEERRARCAPRNGDR